MKINIEKYIPELLYRHDCVIIPGFGGFIGNYSPATINPVYHTFYPPFKSLLFNIHLKQNDGLLASFISQAEKITYEHALSLIRMMLEEWTLQLENNQEIVIEKVGRIIKESNDILQFEQDASVNYLPEAFGLTSLVSPAVRRAGKQEKLEKKLNRYIQSPYGKTGRLTKSLKWAAMIALPVGLTVYLSLTNIDKIRSFHQNYSGFLFPNPSWVIKKNIIPPKVVLLTKKTTNPAETRTSTEYPVTVAKETPEVKQGTATSTDLSATKPFGIIVGAFRFRENAVNLVAKLRQEGYDARIFDTTNTGLARVSIGAYDNREEALAQLAALRSGAYSSAWLLSK